MEFGALPTDEQLVRFDLCWSAIRRRWADADGSSFRRIRKPEFQCRRQGHFAHRQFPAESSGHRPEVFEALRKSCLVFELCPEQGDPYLFVDSTAILSRAFL